MSISALSGIAETSLLTLGNVVLPGNNPLVHENSVTCPRSFLANEYVLSKFFKQNDVSDKGISSHQIRLVYK